MSSARLPRSLLLLALALSLAPSRSLAEQPGEPERVFDLDAPLFEPGVLDPANGQVGRWQRELDRRAALLEAHPGKDHVAALSLLGLLPSLLGEVDRATLIAFVDGVRNDKRRHPLVRALADDTRAQLHEDAGELAEAHALYAASGRLLSWRIIGPFDNANRGGHDDAFGPELEPWAPGPSFEGKLAGEPLDWRAYEPENANNVGDNNHRLGVMTVCSCKPKDAEKDLEDIFATETDEGLLMPEVDLPEDESVEVLLPSGQCLQQVLE